MRVLGVIPARYASTRFPGKPLIDLKGKSMIQRVYEGCLKSSLISDLVVATDDDRIFKHVQGFGGKVMMTSEEHPSGTDRCAEVAQNFSSADVVINIQGDEPLVDYRQIDALISRFKSDEETKIATLGIRMAPERENNPNRIKVVCDSQMNALYFSRSFIPNVNRAKQEHIEKHAFYRHIGLYAYRSETLKEITCLQPSVLEQIESLEQLRWLYHGYKISIVETAIETPNIDVPDDVQKVLGHL